jgi:hypothetical protein
MKKLLCVAVVAIVFCGIAGEDSWQRPKTTRRYLHPPLAENMYTLWNDGKVIRGNNRHNHDWSEWYYNLKSDVLWVVHGESSEPFDFKTARNILPEDGIPFHALSWKKRGFNILMETFCEVGKRSPACFIRLTVENDGTAKEALTMGIMLRRMREYYAVKGSPDIYVPYETQFEYFKNSEPLEFRSCGFTNTWKSVSSTVRAAGLPDGAEWDGRVSTLRFSVFPAPGSPLSVTLVMSANDGVARPEDWDVARAKAEAFWRGELAKINRLPPAVRDDPGKMRLVKNLTVQMLQCFCRPVGSDLTLPRQGGLQRFVWPWDCKDMLSALGLIGDFGEYVEGALDFYFREYSAEDGRIGPFKNDWVCNSGECLYSFARYCLDTDNRIVWKRHRDAAFRAFDWICAKRAETAMDPGKGLPGLFPSACATDNPTPIQLWCFTDHSTFAGLKMFAKAAERFGDVRGAEVRREADSLQGVIAGIYKKFSDAAAGSDELRIPLTPDGNDDEFRKAGYFDLSQGLVLRMGLLYGYVPQADVMKVYNWHLRNGKASPKGLCANHPPMKNLSDKHVWYTTSSEQHWYNCFKRIGRHDLAELVWNAVLKYSVTEEYYVGERYRDDNPWYFPWSPNASGSGRIILMMLNDNMFGK